MKINEYPKTCNLCGGRVERVYNNSIYWNSYGSGVCYKCVKCGAFVGTHIKDTKRALGILANKEMRELKVQCHTIFDTLWDTKRNRSINRSACYEWLSVALDIPKDECHFGWFDTPMLKKALKVLQHQGFTQSAKLLLQQHKEEATAMLDQVIQDVNQTSAKCGKRWSFKRLNKRIAEVKIKNEVSKQKDRLWPLL